MSSKQNEHWTKKYIAGGLYEFCLLQYYISDKKQFDHYLSPFGLGKSEKKPVNLC